MVVVYISSVCVVWTNYLYFLNNVTKYINYYKLSIHHKTRADTFNIESVFIISINIIHTISLVVRIVIRYIPTSLCMKRVRR